MSTIAKGEITLSPVNDAYTVLLTPATCTIRADFDGSHPSLDNAHTTITVKRGTKAVDFKIVAPHISESGIEFTYAKQSNKSIKIAITKIPSSILSGWVSFDIVTEDGFAYSTNVQFNFSIARESTMLDWIQDWEGSKTKVGGTYIMTPKLFVGKKEEIITIVDGSPIWMPGALTGVYIGPDILKSGENSAGIYGYLKDKEIFHINADGGFIGGWTFNQAGLQSGNGVVNILAEGTIFAQNPKSTTPYWGIYADGHAIFANGNVKFQADGSAEFAGKITSASGTIGGWTITKNQLYSDRIILDSSNGLIGINASKFQIINAATGDLEFPAVPDGGVKLWYNSSTDFGLAGWTTGAKVFQLGSYNMIAGWRFNHQAIWIGDTAPSLTQGAYTAESDAITIAPNGIRSSKWYVDANGTASFVGGLVKFNTDNAKMFGWLMRDGRFSSKHAALISSDYYCGLYVSPADLSDIGANSLLQTINNNGGIYLYSDGANSIMRAYDKKGNLGFYLSTSGYNTIGKWNFDHESIYTGSKNVDDHGFARDNNSIILGINGLIGPMWKLLADGSGAVAGGNIAWTKDGKVTFSEQVTLSWSSITNGPNLTKIDANGIYTGTISADNISAGSISTADIICKDKWALMRDGTGYLAAGNISWQADGTLTVKGHVEANSGVIGGFKITDSGIFSLETNCYTGDVKNGSFAMFSQGGSAFLCFHDDGRWAGIGLNCSSAGGTATVARFENYYTGGIFANWSTNIALYLRAENAEHNFAFLGKGNGILNGYIAGSKLSLFTLAQYNTIYSGYIKPAENNRWIVKATADKTGFQLPSCSEIASALGLNTTSAWAVEFIIIGDIGSNIFTVYGKYLKVIGDAPNQTAPWCREGDPLLINVNGARIDSVNIGAGDSLRLLFVNNPDETKADPDSEITLNGVKKKVTWSYKYTARILNYAT